MRKALWLFTLISVYSMGCDRLRWTNQIYDVALECGVSDDFSSDTTLLLKFAGFEATADKKDLEVFKVNDANTIEPLDFELTPKHCIKLTRKKADASHRVAVIFKKRQAADFIPDNPSKTIITAQLRDCGSLCHAFPLCGLIPESGDERTSKSVFKLQVPEGVVVNASIESDFVTRPLEINERQCFALSASSSGNLKVQDTNGNFYEGSVEQVLAQSARSQLPVEKLALRGPLTQQERFCKLNSEYYRMDGMECVPKTFQDFCKDSPWHVGVIALNSFFVRPDCGRIDQFLQNAKTLDFSYKNLTNLDVFSGLKNLKELDLSGNKIKSLNSLLDTLNIEILKINYNSTGFDVSSLARFNKLKVLSLASSDVFNAEQLAVMDSVEELLISRFDVTLLSKFPRLKKLTLRIDTDLDISSIPNKELESLTIHYANNVSGLPSLMGFEKLKELDFKYIENFANGGRMPYMPSLASLSISESPLPNMDDLVGIKSLEDLTVDSPKTPMKNAFPSLQNVKAIYFVSYDDVDLSWLACCSNLEALTLRGMFDSLETLPLLPKVRSFDGQQLELKSVAGLEKLPRLEYLDLTLSSQDLDFADFPELPYLEELIYTTTGGLPAKQSSLAWLKNAPALRSLMVAANPVEADLGAVIPKNLDKLLLISNTVEDLSFLKNMKSLRILGLYLKEANFKDASAINLQPLESLVIDVPAATLSRLPRFGSIEYLLVDTVAWDDRVTEDDVSPLEEKIQEVKEMRISGDVISLGWLEKVEKLESLIVNAPFKDFQNFVQLPFLKSLVIASTEFNSLNGVEKFMNLERLEFETSNRIETLKPLSVLKNLKELVGPSMRRNFPDVDTCPEDVGFPEGLRTYCRALDIPFALPYGPLPI